MKLTFKLSIVQGCVLQIKDTTREYNSLEYLDENENRYNHRGRFKYSDTFTVNVIKYKKYLADKSEIVETIITPHPTETSEDEAYHSLTKDGHYIIDHIILPSIDLAGNLITLKQLNSLETIGIEDYKHFYATDGTNFYKYINNTPELCSIEEIIEMDSEETNVSKISQETFSICFLHKCYLDRCKSEFERVIRNRCADVNYNSDKITDLIWLSINAIKYNIEFGRLSQAQSILEDLLRCGQFCKPVKYTNHDCGCCK